MTQDKQHLRATNTPWYGHLVFYWPIVLLWLITFWYMLILNVHVLIWPAAAILAGILGFEYLVRERQFSPATVKIWRKTRKIIFLSLPFLAVLSFFHPASWINPALTAVLTIAAALLAYIPMSDRSRGKLLGLFALILSILLAIQHDWFKFSCFLGFAVVLATVAVKKSDWIPKRFPLFLGFWFLGVSVVLIGFYTAPPADQTDRILAQPDVTALFTTTGNNPYSRLLGHDTRFVKQKCGGGYVVGTRGQAWGMYFLRNKKLLPVEIRNVSDFIVQDCRNDELWAGDFKRNLLYLVDPESGEVKRQIELKKMRGVSAIRFEPESRTLYISRDDTKLLARYSIIPGEYERVQLNDYITDFEPFEEINALFSTQWGGFVRRYQLFPMKSEDYFFSPDLLLQLDIDRRDLVGYVTKFYQGRVIRFNLSTMEVLNETQLEPGLRFPEYNRRRRLVVVTNFFSGWAYLLDSDDLSVVDKRYFGPRLRSAFWTNHGDAILAASSLGGFEWKLPPNLHGKHNAK